MEDIYADISYWVSKNWNFKRLKFASEKYFRGEISSQELLDTAKNLRKIHWTTQKNEGIDSFQVMILIL